VPSGVIAGRRVVWSSSRTASFFSRRASVALTAAAETPSLRAAPRRAAQGAGVDHIQKHHDAVQVFQEG